ncbi:MAG: hypothetical protein C4554_05290 [Dethiobacter sp.]|nr:MAG: hypothetical protein C4554_05290 [Dethiobacter sp.]
MGDREDAAGGASLREELKRVVGSLPVLSVHLEDGGRDPRRLREILETFQGPGIPITYSLSGNDPPSDDILLSMASVSVRLSFPEEALEDAFEGSGRWSHR